MRRLMHWVGAIALVFAAPSLAGCATIPTAPPNALARVAAIDRAYAAYQRIKLAATIARPFLSQDAADAIDAAEAKAEQAFAAARAAETIAEQLEQLRNAEAAGAAIEATATADQAEHVLDPLPATDAV